MIVDHAVWVKKEQLLLLVDEHGSLEARDPEKEFEDRQLVQDGRVSDFDFFGDLDRQLNNDHGLTSSGVVHDGLLEPHGTTSARHFRAGIRVRHVGDLERPRFNRGRVCIVSATAALISILEVERVTGNRQVVLHTLVVILASIVCYDSLHLTCF